VEGGVLNNVIIYKEFTDLCLKANTVIFCRVTPHQKASVVNVVKQREKTTLAIGDGGNDVSMIQQAHVGVGISGREGLQAARAADYVIARFRFLERLLLIHGHYSYVRTAYISQYCFYKSTFICFIQIIYNFLCGFSGTTYFNTFSLTFYNIIFTSMPVIFYVLDLDLPQKFILKNPATYVLSQKGIIFNAKTFFSWILRAFYQASMGFLITMAFYAYSGDIDYQSVSMITYTILIGVNTLTMTLESNTLTKPNLIIIWGTFILYFVLMSIINSFTSFSLYMVIFRLFSQPKFWLTIIMGCSLAILPVHSIQYFISENYPSVYQKLKLEARSNSNKYNSLTFFSPLPSTNSKPLDKTPLLITKFE